MSFYLIDLQIFIFLFSSFINVSSGVFKRHLLGYLGEIAVARIKLDKK